MKYDLRVVSPSNDEGDQLHDGYVIIAYSETFGCWFDLSGRYARYADAEVTLSNLRAKNGGSANAT